MNEQESTHTEVLRHKGDEPHLLREIVRAYQSLMAGFSRKVGAPPSQFMLMRLLAVAENDIGVMDIARQLGVNAAAVTHQVKLLEKEGFISRRSDPKDGRRNYISLSPKGRKLAVKVHERTHELEQVLSSVIGDKEMREAAMVLSKLRTFIENIR